MGGFFYMAFNNIYLDLWRDLARTSPIKDWLWKIRSKFRVRTDQAIAYWGCGVVFLFGYKKVNPILLFNPCSKMRINVES